MRWIREHDHLLRAYLWLILAIPTILWWKESILWKAEKARREASS